MKRKQKATNDHNNKAHLYKPDGNWVQKGILTPSEKATKKHKKWLCVYVESYVWIRRRLKKNCCGSTGMPIQVRNCETSHTTTTITATTSSSPPPTRASLFISNGNRANYVLKITKKKREKKRLEANQINFPLNESKMRWQTKESISHKFCMRYGMRWFVILSVRIHWYFIVCYRSTCYDPYTIDRMIKAMKFHPFFFSFYHFISSCVSLFEMC